MVVEGCKVKVNTSKTHSTTQSYLLPRQRPCSHPVSRPWNSFVSIDKAAGGSVATKPVSKYIAGHVYLNGAPLCSS